MTLFSVLNSYTGASAISVLVIAATESDALSLAMVKFYRKVNGTDASYFNPRNMRVIELCPDTSKPWASEVSDGAHEG